MQRWRSRGFILTSSDHRKVSMPKKKRTDNVQSERYYIVEDGLSGTPNVKDRNTGFILCSCDSETDAEFIAEACNHFVKTS